MPNSSIWVLVANEQEASICASRNGTSHLLRSVRRRHSRGEGARAGSIDACVSSLSKGAFAGDLMLALCRGALERAYDGVIIVANASMMEQLRRIKPNAVARLLIAEIVEDPGEHFSLAGLPDPTFSSLVQQCA